MHKIIKKISLPVNFVRYQMRLNSSKTDPNLKKLTLFGFKISQPTRSVIMLLQANALEYDFVEINALTGDTRKPEFRAQFPSGLVPALKDRNGFIVEESCAILQYLCETRGFDDHWYPKDPQIRSKVNYWLHWHHSNTRKATIMVLHSRLFPTALFPTLTRQNEKYEDGIKDLKRSLSRLNTVLSNRDYLAGDQPSIADLIILPELDQHLPDAFAMINFAPYPYLLAWIQRLQNYPFYVDTFDPVKHAALLLLQQENARNKF